MPLSCAAFGCSNHNMMKEKHRFFRFPNKDMERRSKWINACKRRNKDGTPWEPKGKNVYLCGKHFVTGAPVKDPKHPDYIPSIFVTSKSEDGKDIKTLSRNISAKKRQATQDQLFVEAGIVSKIGRTSQEFHLVNDRTKTKIDILKEEVEKLVGGKAKKN